MAEDLLTKDDFNKILQSRFNNPSVKFISSTIKPISINREGFMGEHYKLQITYELDNISLTEDFFIKTKPTGIMQREMVDSSGVYRKEIFAYDFLFKEFKKHNFDVSFTAKCYYCIPDQTLIMEDLATRGYSLSKRQTFFSIEQLHCLLKSIASLHAAGFAYEQVKTSEFGHKWRLIDEHSECFKENLYDLHSQPESALVHWWKSSLATAEYLIDLLPEEEDFKTEFKQLLSSYPIGKIFTDETNLVKTIGHGDLWSNNMMFKYDQDVAVKCTLVDFQLIRYFYPSFDVLLAIGFNASPELRKHNFHELCQFYYNTLSDSLEKYGYSIEDMYPKEDFDKSLVIGKIDALLQVICVNIFLYLPAEILTKSMEDCNKEDMETMQGTMSNLVAVAFKENALYKTVVSELLYDLREALVNKSVG